MLDIDHYQAMWFFIKISQHILASFRLSLMNLTMCRTWQLKCSGRRHLFITLFFFSALGILLVAGIVLLPILLPVAVTDHGKHGKGKTTSNGTFSDLDKLSMGNIRVSSKYCLCLLPYVTFTSTCLEVEVSNMDMSSVFKCRTPQYIENFACFFFA